MRKVSVSLMAALLMAMSAISCSPERELFSDITVKDESVRSAEGR